MAAVRRRGEAGSGEGPIRPPAEAGDGRAVRPRIDEPVRSSTPSPSSQRAQVSVEKAEEFAPCSSCGPDDLDEEDCGAKVMTSRIKPTQEMRDAHNVSRLPFRSWYSCCVRRRAVSVGHSHSAPYGDEQNPTIAVDYGFLGGAPFIAVKDRHTKLLWSIIVPNTGLEPSLYGARAFLSAIGWAGYKRLILKSDREFNACCLCVGESTVLGRNYSGGASVGGPRGGSANAWNASRSCQNASGVL